LIQRTGLIPVCAPCHCPSVPLIWYPCIFGWYTSMSQRPPQALLLHISLAHEHKPTSAPLSLMLRELWRFDRKEHSHVPRKSHTNISLLPLDAMIAELHTLDIEPMVSIWPTVDKRSPNYPNMLEAGHLIRTDRGLARPSTSTLPTPPPASSSGRSPNRTTTTKGSRSSGLTRQSRNTVSMISTTTGIMLGRVCRWGMCIRSSMRGRFMKGRRWRGRSRL
jgi:hypothetical protein